MHADFFAGVEISTWSTDAGAVDVLRDIPDRAGRSVVYAELAARGELRTLHEPDADR